MSDMSGNQFSYGGARYLFIAKLVNSNNIDAPDALKVPIIDTILVNENIQRFEYVSQLNQLYLTGSIIYTDKYGQIDKYLETQSTYCTIDFIQYNEEKDGDIASQVLSDKLKFQHVFFVKSIEILERNHKDITYRINLISRIWIKLISTIFYTNYDKKPESIFDIMKNIFSQAAIDIDKESFDKVVTPVELNYITNGNDNVLTCFNYLMRRLYYYPDQKDSAVKFIYYDDLTNKIKLFNTADSLLRQGDVVILLSFFKTTNETNMHSIQNNFATVTKFPKTDAFKQSFNVNLADFDYSTNSFSTKSINYQEIATYQNTGIELENTIGKYFPIIDDFGAHPENVYSRNGSYWDNDFDVYHDVVSQFLEDNSLVVNTDGKLTTHVASYVNVSIDRSIGDALDTEDIDDVEEMKIKYKSFEGTWIVSKVRTQIVPGKNQFRQNLVLFRNFMFKQDSNLEI